MMLAYHELALTGGNDVYALSVEDFSRHAEIVSQRRGKSHCLTFDDGHMSNYELARPVLQALAIPAAFFVTTCWVDVLDTVMTWSHLRELSSEGFVLGSHTHTHALLTGCGEAALRNELRSSKMLLEDRVGREVTLLSLPGGRGDARVLRACREAGYECVYTSRVGQYLPATDTMPEVIGRYVVTRATSERTLNAYLNGSPATCGLLRLESSAKGWAKMLVGDGLYRRAWRKIARSQSYGT